MLDQPADPFVDAALRDANRSYAPYTKDFSGVALECEDGRVYTGGHEENAAYDPSLAPFQAAFAMIIFGGAPGAPAKVSRADFVEPSTKSAKISEVGGTQVSLSSIAPGVKLEIHNTVRCPTPTAVGSGLADFAAVTALLLLPFALAARD